MILLSAGAPRRCVGAFNDKKIAGVMHMEGAEAIGPTSTRSTSSTTWACARSARCGAATVFGYGVPFKFPGTPDIGPGLTDRGKELIRLCNELGILIDLSHMNQAGFETWRSSRLRRWSPTALQRPRPSRLAAQPDRIRPARADP